VPTDGDRVSRGVWRKIKLTQLTQRPKRKDKSGVCCVASVAWRWMVSRLRL